MALVPVVSVGGGVAVLSLDVDGTGTVVAVSFTNTSAVPALVAVTRPSGNIWSQTLGLGTFNFPIVKGKQFAFNDVALSDWLASITMGWTA